MQVLGGIMKVQDYQMKKVNLVNRKWKEDVDLSDKLYQYIEGLDSGVKLEAKEDIEKYLQYGPIDSIDIIVASNKDRHTIVTEDMYKRLYRYVDADRKVVRITFKFYNALERCTYVCKDVSGDYLLIPIWCKTGNEELRAQFWCREIFKSIIKQMFDKYGTGLTVEDALSRLEIKE